MSPVVIKSRVTLDLIVIEYLTHIAFEYTGCDTINTNIKKVDTVVPGLITFAPLNGNKK